MIGAWLLAAALAHGPAPAPLQVLAVGTGSGCLSDEVMPLALRSSVGILRASEDGSWRYGCTVRVGGVTAAPAAASPRGDVAVVASSGGVVWDDGACTPKTWPAPGTVVAVAWAGDGAWLATRGADDGALWRVTASGLALAQALDFAPDGLVVDGDDVWVAGAGPTPALARWSDGALTAVPDDGWPAGFGPYDRLAPRVVDGARVGLVALGVTEEELLWADDEGVARGPTGGRILGPVEGPDGLLALVDGQVHAGTPGGLLEPVEGPVVDWTCLSSQGGLVWACRLPEVVRVDAWRDGLATTSVFTFAQLGPPADDCPDPGGACAADWLHEAGESGWADREPATCPDGSRDIPVTCGCAQGAGGGALPLLAAFALRVRRRRSPQRAARPDRSPRLRATSSTARS